jgi:RNA polymerase sigma factor (sigma-70 family)
VTAAPQLPSGWTRQRHEPLWHRAGRDNGATRYGRRYDWAVAERASELVLIERLLARDERALREIIDAFGRLVYSVARKTLQDRALAEEVAQETFLALWWRPGAFDPDRGSLQSFLLGIARNKAVDLVRREHSLRYPAESLLAKEAWESASGSRPETMEEALERQDLLRALSRLTRVQKEALVLAYFGGRTYREVAVELGIPEGTAKTRLRDGLTRLRELMTGQRES